MSLAIKTYIKNPYQKITHLRKKKREAFIPIEDVIELKKLSEIIDRDYIEGCIEIVYQETTILDFRYWDLVDQLWSYIITLIEQYYAQGSASTYFPDQPLKLSLQKKTGLEVSLIISSSKGEKVWIIPEREFIYGLLDAAKLFFKTLHTLEWINHVTYNYEMQRIKTLEDISYN